MRGFKKMRRKRMKSALHVLSAGSRTKKMSYYSAMDAMPHTIHTASVSMRFLLDTGFAWNARKMEHTPELLDGELHYLRHLPQELKPQFAVIVDMRGQTNGLEHGMILATASMLPWAWTSTSRMTINPCRHSVNTKHAPQMRQDSLISGGNV
jgi:hypothetical protein